VPYTEAKIAGVMSAGINSFLPKPTRPINSAKSLAEVLGGKVKVVMR
jgi:hypothetical protein